MGNSENKEPIDHDASEASKDENDLEYSQIPIQDTDDATTTKLHVLSFNVWGMPGGLGGCKYKQERMEALADMIKSRTPYFDLMLLTELWMQADHQLLEDAAKNVGLYMTGFRQLASKYCDGRVLITNCSGLAIISAYPLKEVEFHQYTRKGTIKDLEIFAGKGVGRVRIAPRPNTKVDVFVTHLIAYSNKVRNNYFRIKQAEELVESYLKKSTADAVILGGDFNALPILEPGTPYYIIQQYMKNACEELFGQLEEWLLPKFATYGNQRNSFSNMYDPVTLDYIFHAGTSPGTITWANRFELPILHTNITQAQKEVLIPLSDHEPVISTIYVKKI
jgi:endonuclease/exonuclease/phosphatase family metal-dependent hydrolase